MCASTGSGFCPRFTGVELDLWELFPPFVMCVYYLLGKSSHRSSSTPLDLWELFPPFVMCVYWSGTGPVGTFPTICQCVYYLLLGSKSRGGGLTPPLLKLLSLRLLFKYARIGRALQVQRCVKRFLQLNFSISISRKWKFPATEMLEWVRGGVTSATQGLASGTLFSLLGPAE